MGGGSMYRKCQTEGMARQGRSVGDPIRDDMSELQRKIEFAKKVRATRRSRMTERATHRQPDGAREAGGAHSKRRRADD